MGVSAWTDLSFDGKEIRKITRRLYHNLDVASKAKNPDWDKITTKLEAVSRVSLRHAKIVEIVDTQPRIKNLEKLIESIPAHILAEAKAKIGI